LSCWVQFAPISRLQGYRETQVDHQISKYMIIPSPCPMMSSWLTSPVTPLTPRASPSSPVRYNRRVLRNGTLCLSSPLWYLVVGRSTEHAYKTRRRHLISFTLLGNASNYSVNCSLEWKNTRMLANCSIGMKSIPCQNQ
jgi:hypothetical protein